MRRYLSALHPAFCACYFRPKADMKMSRTALAIICALPLVSACADDDTSAGCGDKVEFNLGGEADTDGDGRLTAVASGNTISFDVSYTCDFPADTSDQDIIDALGPASELTITNNDTSVTVSLASAIAPELDGSPDATGEWAISHNSDDRTFTFTIYHMLETGQQLRVGGDYTAVFSLGPNDFADEIPGTSADLEVVGG